MLLLFGVRLLWHWAFGVAVGLLGRAWDLATLARAPVVLLAYVRAWGRGLLRYAYRRPVTFEDRRALKLAHMDVHEVMFGESLVGPMLPVLRAAGVGPTSRVVDVGAGRGRALFAARLLGASARGIELRSWHVAPVQAALASAGIELVEGDATAAPIHDATHVLLCWCALAESTRARVLQRLAECAPGTRVIAVGLPALAPFLRPVLTTRALFSWGTASVYVAERR